MVLEVYEDKKFACYWFTREDLEDKALLESLIPEQKEWNKKATECANIIPARAIS